jgi:hypothetical protein
LSFLHQGQDLDGGRRAHVTEQGKNLVLNDQLLGVGHAAGRIVAVIIGNDLYLAAVDAALGVDMFEIGHGTVQGLGAQITGVAAQRQG